MAQKCSQREHKLLHGDGDPVKVTQDQEEKRKKKDEDKRMKRRNAITAATMIKNRSLRNGKRR